MGDDDVSKADNELVGPQEAKEVIRQVILRMRMLISGRAIKSNFERAD
jgi:hypothetical protein